MKAMIFAAGLGTRLRPFTNDKPKALVPVAGMPLLEYTIRRLRTAGVRELVVNVHHFADKVEAFLNRKHHFGLNIHISDEREQLLNTGGGLKAAAHWLQDSPFLLLNTDIVSNIDLLALHRAHLRSGALATLATRDRDTSRYLLFDASGQLCGWKNLKTGARKKVRASDVLQPRAFSGIQVVSPAIFAYMSAEESVFSIIDTYLRAAASERILSYPHDTDIWLDVGKPDQLLKQQLLPE